MTIAIAGQAVVIFSAVTMHMGRMLKLAIERRDAGDAKVVIAAFPPGLKLDAGDSPAPCVVLSACELGLATVRPGDEALGLTSVLLPSGARAR